MGGKPEESRTGMMLVGGRDCFVWRQLHSSFDAGTALSIQNLFLLGSDLEIAKIIGLLLLAYPA